MAVTIDGTTGLSPFLVQAGSTAGAPIDFLPGTLMTTATPGAIEYDGRVLYGTPLGTQRGVIASMQVYRLNANLVRTATASAQSIFGVGCTLSSNTIYAFDACFALGKTLSTTSHTIGLSFAGTASNNYFSYNFWGNASSNTTSLNSTQSTALVSTTSNTVLTGSLTSATQYFWATIRGSISVNAGGTFIPRFTQSSATPGPYSTLAGSYFMIYPIGAAGSNTSVGTWS
jgi:hypothetical protein